MQLYLVVPEGEPWGSYNTERCRSVALTPVEAVIDMARRDFQEFGSREEKYDVYLHQKLPKLMGTFDAPPEEECASTVKVEPRKACGCSGEACKHSAQQDGEVAKLVALFIAEGVADPADLAQKVIALKEST